MAVNGKVLGAFLVFAVVMGLLAAFGQRLGMSHEALRWCQTCAALIGAAVLNALPAIFARVEDAITPPRPTQVPPSRTGGQ